MNSLDDLRAVFEEDAAKVGTPLGVTDRSVRAGALLLGRRRAVTALVAAVVAVAIAVPVALLSSGPEPVAPAGPGLPTSTSGSPDEAVGRGETGAIAGLPLSSPPAIAYAVGTTIVDGDRRLDIGAEVLDFVRVGDRYAAVVADGADQQLNLYAGDGTRVELDSGGSIIGLAAGDEVGEPALAWAWNPRLAPHGRSWQVRALLDPSDPQQLATIDVDSPTIGVGVLDVRPEGVVFAGTGDPGGPAEIWNPVTDLVRPLLPLAGGVGPHLLGITDDGVAVSYDEYGESCIEAYQLPAADHLLWERCVERGDFLMSPDARWLFQAGSVVDTMDGDPVIDLAIGEWGTGSATWETTSSLLITMDRGVIRCSVPAGTCERAPVGTVDGWRAETPVLFGSG